MTSIQQREKLHNQIWAIASDIRGSIDGWDFKQYVLGTLLYRFISEDFADFMGGGNKKIYEEYPDKEITQDHKQEGIKSKGYFIYPSQLFVNVVKKANNNDNLNIDLRTIFNQIESSSSGTNSEEAIKGLFNDFDTTDNKLGSELTEKIKTLRKVLNGINSFDFGDFKKAKIDLFGDAYEFLISNYSANAGKSGGEFFTPQSVAKLLVKLATNGKTKIDTIYDPAAGSGSLLLQAKKILGKNNIDTFYGQEKNITTYNLARMNMLLHNVGYNKFHIAHGDTLINPYFKDEAPFCAIVSNPPYSIAWEGNDNPTLINDDRFAPAGVLAPKSKADFAFILHSLSYLSTRGKAAIVCFPGIFYRSGVEQKIRKYLIDQNYIESIISLPPNLFFGTSISTNILILSKGKSNTKTQFIDASKLYKKQTNNNILEDSHIEEIIKVFTSKEDIKHFSKCIDYEIIKKNDYNLQVSAYVEAEDTRENIDINKVNNELKITI